jgi:hypothetical protein
MKLVDRSEIVRRQMVDLLPRLLQRGNDDVPKVFSGVMGLYWILGQYFLLFAGTGGSLLSADNTLR